MWFLYLMFALIVAIIVIGSAVSNRKNKKIPPQKVAEVKSPVENIPDDDNIKALKAAYNYRIFRIANHCMRNPEFMLITNTICGEVSIWFYYYTMLHIQNSGYFGYEHRAANALYEMFSLRYKEYYNNTYGGLSDYVLNNHGDIYNQCLNKDFLPLAAWSLGEAPQKTGHFIIKMFYVFGDYVYFPYSIGEPYSPGAPLPVISIFDTIKFSQFLNAEIAEEFVGFSDDIAGIFPAPPFNKR